MAKKAENWRSSAKVGLEPVHKGLTAAREFICGRIVPVSVDDATLRGNISTGNGAR